MIGQTLGHYKILDKLGAGGMGEVYLAEDTTLKRQVALKVLPPDLAASQERLERFQREAESLAALNHPNIVHVYSVEEDEGTHFITMELVEGQPLSHLIKRGGLPLEQIFEFAIPLADALATAHDKGIIHRDLKPANIMVSDEGRVKVLDFGLAKLRQEAEALLSSQLPTEPLTGEGRIIGTMPYMSPEQLEGKDIDSRSDIFSLGVVLYEMATGERPFKGDTSVSIISSIVKDEPRPVDAVKEDLPHHMARIVRRCLEKEPKRRYQSVLDVRNELEDLRQEETSQTAVLTAPVPEPKGSKGRRWWSVVVVLVLLLLCATAWLILRPEPGEEEVIVAESEPPMIVVLPFENLGSPEDEYFADGMTEEITSRLAVVSGMRVISRTSAMQYKEDRPPLKQIGSELGVDYVLEGTVRWARTADSSRVRITPQLIQVSDDTHLWADTYDREIEDIFEVQSDIAGEVIAALDITLKGDDQAALEQRPTDNIEAYQAYLRGLESMTRISVVREFALRAVEHFERAVELDPSFVEAWGQLSRGNSYLYHVGWDRTEERLSRAKAALNGAERADSESLSTQLARGYYYYHGLGDYDRALRELESIADRLPNDREVLAAIAAIYRRQGRLEEAIHIYERVTDLDPRDSGRWSELATSYRAMRQTDKTLTAQDRWIELQPDLDSAYVFKAASVAELTGDLKAARAILEQAPGMDEATLTRGWISQFYLERDWDGVIEMAQSLKGDDPSSTIFRDSTIAWNRFLRDGLEAARPEIEKVTKTAEAMIASAPDDANYRYYTSWFYPILGDEEAALRDANILVESTAKDAFEGPGDVENLAFVYAWIGRTDAALDILEDLLETNYLGAITVHQLELEADWDPLRDHPRFQALLEKYGQEAG